MSSSIHQRFSDNILIGASVVATPTPLTTYSASTLLTYRPADRVRWGSPGSPNQYRLRFHLSGGSPAPKQQADVLVIPCSNISGSLHLTSDDGMNVSITIPTMLPSGIPRTIAADLTTLDTNASHRTSNAFDLVINGMTTDLIMGGAVLLYGPKRTFTNRDWQYGFQQAQTGYAVRHQNDYGTDLTFPLRTRTRQLTLKTTCSVADALDLELWADTNYGDGLPGFVWPKPGTYEGMFGRLQPTQSQTIRINTTTYVQVGLTFNEISKGKPVA
jgi:hypothetical protein